MVNQANREVSPVRNTYLPHDKLYIALVCSPCLRAASHCQSLPHDNVINYHFRSPTPPRRAVAILLAQAFPERSRVLGARTLRLPGNVFSLGAELERKRARDLSALLICQAGPTSEVFAWLSPVHPLSRKLVTADSLVHFGKNRPRRAALADPTIAPAMPSTSFELSII